MKNTTCIIPAMRGRETLLERAIISAEINNFDEIIVVGQRGLNKICDKHNVTFLQKEEAWTSQRYNIGVKAAKSDFIMLLNDDDFYFYIPDIYDSDVPLIYSDYFILKHGSFAKYVSKPMILTENNYIGYMTVRIKRKILIDNPFDETLKFHEDYEMWMRLHKKGCPFQYYPVSFSVYDDVPSKDRKRESEKEKTIVREKLWKKYRKNGKEKQ